MVKGPNESLCNYRGQKAIRRYERLVITPATTWLQYNNLPQNAMHWCIMNMDSTNAFRISYDEDNPADKTAAADLNYRVLGLLGTTTSQICNDIVPSTLWLYALANNQEVWLEFIIPQGDDIDLLTKRRL